MLKSPRHRQSKPVEYGPPSYLLAQPAWTSVGPVGHVGGADQARLLVRGDGRLFTSLVVINHGGDCTAARSARPRRSWAPVPQLQVVVTFVVLNRQNFLDDGPKVHWRVGIPSQRGEVCAVTHVHGVICVARPKAAYRAAQSGEALPHRFES